MSTEIWKTVVGFPNYEVSDLGRVRNAATSKVLKPYPSGTTGCLQVSLFKDGVSSRRTVNHLVAEHFMDVVADGYRIEYVNGNILDNRLVNLRVNHSRAVGGRGQERNPYQVRLQSSVLSRFDI